MKTALYLINFILLVAIVVMAKQSKALQRSKAETPRTVLESADPVLEAVEKKQQKTLPTKQIIQKSIFHVERKEGTTEVSSKDLETKIKDDKSYILRGVIGFGELTAVIAVEQKVPKSPKTKRPRVTRGKTAPKAAEKLYVVGDTIEGSGYKLKSIHSGEPSYVILVQGSSELKISMYSDESKEIAKKSLQGINDHLKKQEKSRPKKPSVPRVIKKKTPAKTPERVI